MDTETKLRELLGRMDADSILAAINETPSMQTLSAILFPDIESPLGRQAILNDARADWWAARTVPGDAKWVLDAKVIGEQTVQPDAGIVHYDTAQIIR